MTSTSTRLGPRRRLAVERPPRLSRCWGCERQPVTKTAFRFGRGYTPAWREGGDSNPRRDLRSLTRLAGGRFQPLSHLPRPGPVYVVSGSQPSEIGLLVE